MKKHIAMLGLLLSLLISLPSSGQLLGYGSGVYGNKTWTSTDGILYTDQTRAHVVSISGNTVEIEGTPHNFSSSPLYNNALIIQMVGGNQGKHTGVTITGSAVSGSNTILTLSSSLSGYSTGGSNRVQIILVLQFDNFTLDGGMVTCHPWDGKTGGVLAMMVRNSLTVNGGYFTVAGRGFYPEGVSWGVPGTGGGANTGYGTGGIAGPGGNAAGTPGYSACNVACISGPDLGLVAAGNAGGSGSASGTTKGLGSVNSGTGITYGTSNLNTLVIMGSAGYYGSGTGAGDGGEGGGAGGGGGASNSNPGYDGDPGQDGALGGKPGEGARGGGIMYIKAGYFYNNTGGPVYFGNGGRGENGRPGENGGNGGQGGKGGLGECSGGSAHFSGGTGGSGIPGNGSEGGDGADGGHPGYLWLISAYGTAPVLTSDVDIRGGSGGEGGDGGYSFTTICLSSEPMVMNGCSLNLTQCPSGVGGGGGCATKHSCDCDRAYQLLRTAVSSGLYAPDIYVFYNGFSQIVAYYDLNKGELTGYEVIGCREFYYHCPVFSKDVCNEIFTNIINFETFIGPYTLPDNVVNVGTIEFGVVESKIPTDYVYYLEYNSDNEYLVDYTNPTGYMKCYNGSCLAETYTNTGIYHINQGSKGTSGQSVSNGNSGGSTANFPTSGTIGWKNGPSGVNQSLDQIGIKLYPSPAVAELKFGISTESAESLEVSIYDLSGKLIEIVHFETTAGENEFTINVESLATGVYYFKAVMGGKSSALSFVKQ